MLQGKKDPLPVSKSELYEHLAKDLQALIGGESDCIVNSANASSLLFYTLPEINWAGFYFLKNGELVVGPFQGKPACVRIAMGRGVCGTAALRRETIVVRNVHDFPGHIACDSDSQSEIVVPLIRKEILYGLLDIDSPRLSRFDDDDRRGLERFVNVFLEMTDIRF